MKKFMENAATYAIVALAIFIVVSVVIFVPRWVANTATPVDVIYPKEGITCVKVAGGDSVAISCVKD